MPWNGSGIFNLVFNWPTDAANSIPISSTRMQTQEQDIATGLQNCLTLDGQTVPVADIGWGGFELKNLKNPTAAQSAATRAYVDATALSYATGLFQTFSPACTFASANSFTTPGNQTANFIPGRRLKIVHNTGGTTSYATVTSSVFAASTTVTVLVDNAVALVSTITAVSIGIDQGSPDADPRRSFVFFASTVNQPATFSSYTPFTGTKGTYCDPLGEFTAGTGIFVPLRSGIYRCSLNGSVLRAGATVAAGYQIHIGFAASNGGVMVGPGYVTDVQVLLPLATFTLVGFGGSFVVPLVAGFSYRFWTGNDAGQTYTGGPMTVSLVAGIEALYYN